MGEQNDDDGVARGKAAWSRLMHIGAHTGDVDDRPDLAALGVPEIHRVCVRAWMYSRSNFEPNMEIRLGNSQWRETCALAGSIAESLMLAAATYVEVEWHRTAIATAAEPAGMAIGQRYLAEAAIDTTVAAGHRLINFVVRVARTDPAAQEQLGADKQLKPFGPKYRPFETDARAAWLSLNEATIALLRTALDPTIHTQSLDALDTLIASEPWQAMVDIRAENFHRWRKENEYVTGVDAQSGNARDVHDLEGEFYGRAVEGTGRRHIAADGLTAKTTTVAGAGLQEVTKALDQIITATVETIMPTLTGQSITVDDPKRLRHIRTAAPS